MNTVENHYFRAMWEQAKTIITFDNTFTNDGVGSLDAATGMWTAGVRLIKQDPLNLCLKPYSLNLFLFLRRCRVLMPSQSPATPNMTLGARICSICSSRHPGHFIIKIVGNSFFLSFRNGASLGKKGEWMFAEYGKDSGGRSLVS